MKEMKYIVIASEAKCSIIAWGIGSMKEIIANTNDERLATRKEILSIEHLINKEWNECLTRWCLILPTNYDTQILDKLDQCIGYRTLIECMGYSSSLFSEKTNALDIARNVNLNKEV